MGSTGEGYKESIGMEGNISLGEGEHGDGEHGCRV